MPKNRFITEVRGTQPCLLGKRRVGHPYHKKVALIPRFWQIQVIEKNRQSGVSAMTNIVE